MIRVNHTSQVALDRGDIVELPDPAGRTLVCRAGVLWLTIDDDPKDIVLEAGQCYEASGHRRLLVSALAAARFDVVASGSRTRLSMVRTDAARIAPARPTGLGGRAVGVGGA